MLTEVEMKWLRERARETCERCKTHHLFCDYCNRIYKHSVWARDCFTLSGLSVETTYDELLETAEFEARVAKKLAQGVSYGELPCGADPDCPDKHMDKYNTKETPCLGCRMCVLRAARFEIEAKMEEEGKRV